MSKLYILEVDKQNVSKYDFFSKLRAVPNCQLVYYNRTQLSLS